MKEYDFTLKFAVPIELEAEALEARLFEAGCDDSLPGIGQKGRLALSFSRHAATAMDALRSAIRDVKQAVPEGRLVEVAPDLVGVSDIAELFAFSRQNMRKLFQTHPRTFPLPVHEGRASLWHLADVLDWFAEQQQRAVDQDLREVARASLQVNVERELERLRTSPAERRSSASY